ncbi:MAG: adenylosuccinate lyase [Christensenellaceae bacterium]|jgi:adenylosuccinate lyase|nr:adenylosuccinate lyase [Christensenellaceae bacterium]
MKDRYENPLCSRYASDAMQRLFSADMRYGTWRRLWVALARAQHGLGLPVSAGQVAELAAHTQDIDYDIVAAREKKVRHDVMAHIYAYGLCCPNAAGILHLGATSCYVTDNADLIIYRDALLAIRAQLVAVLKALGAFAERYKALPTLGYTHFQPAQPVTVGKRACLWMQDLALDVQELDDVLNSMRFLGCRGTTGTEASFMELFSGDGAKIDEMNRRIAAEFGFARCYPVCGQTYPRKLDSRVLNVLSSIAQSAYRFAGDMRLLQHDRLLEEPFGKAQVGSSAMAYKRNPMRCERICSLARYVLSLALNAPMTASAQWFERTLDDSANRRISMPEAFLATDSILRVYYDVASGIVVNEAIVAKALQDYLPFAATENLLMEGVKRGGNRQTLHECIRTHAMAASEAMKQGRPCDLLERLAADPLFPLNAAQLQTVLNPADYIGRCAEQVEQFLHSTLPGLGDAAPMQELQV